MRSNVRTAIVLSTCAVILTFASASFAQMVGGYKAVAKTDAGAVAAADFAIEAQSEKTEKEYTLEDIVKAERQVVQGSNYRLCLKVSADGSDTFYVLAVVYVDLKNNQKLSSFVLSTCGETAVAPVSKLPVVGGFGAAAKTDAQVVAAANFAVAERSKAMAGAFALDDILSAERQVVQGMNYRICMLVNVEGDEPFMISTVIYQDFKRNYSLSSWKESECGVAGASM